MQSQYLADFVAQEFIKTTKISLEKLDLESEPFRPGLWGSGNIGHEKHNITIIGQEHQIIHMPYSSDSAGGIDWFHIMIYPKTEKIIDRYTFLQELAENFIVPN